MRGEGREGGGGEDLKKGMKIERKKKMFDKKLSWGEPRCRQAKQHALLFPFTFTTAVPIVFACDYDTHLLVRDALLLCSATSLSNQMVVRR